MTINSDEVLRDESSLFFRGLIFIFSDEISLAICFVILLFFYLGLREIHREGKKTYIFASVSTTLGIFGTFLGLFKGLLNFDTNNLSESIPALLEGMKTGFGTSVFGLFISTVLKMLHAFQSIRLEHMRGPKESVVEKIPQALVDIKNEIVGELVTCSRAIEQGLSRLIEHFDRFSSSVTNDSTHALVQALKLIIQDFNVKVDEQFGNNFKQLNQAVGCLLTWQDNYKTTLELSLNELNQLAKIYSLNASSLESVKLSVDTVIQKAGDLLGTATFLEPILTRLNDENQLLSKQLQIFSQISIDAQAAFPTIFQNIEKMTVGFSEGVNRSSKIILDTVEVQKNSINEQTKHMLQTVEFLSGRMTNLLVEVGTGMELQLSELAKRNAQRIDEQILRLDKALEEELKKSLLSLGNQLAALSRHFVDDYTPLTIKLRELVNTIGAA